MSGPPPKSVAQPARLCLPWWISAGPAEPLFSLEAPPVARSARPYSHGTDGPRVYLVNLGRAGRATLCTQGSTEVSGTAGPAVSFSDTRPGRPSHSSNSRLLLKRGPRADALAGGITPADPPRLVFTHAMISWFQGAIRAEARKWILDRPAPNREHGSSLKIRKNSLLVDRKVRSPCLFDLDRSELASHLTARS